MHLPKTVTNSCNQGACAAFTQPELSNNSAQNFFKLSNWEVGKKRFGFVTQQCQRQDQNRAGWQMRIFFSEDHLHSGMRHIKTVLFPLHPSQAIKPLHILHTKQTTGVSFCSGYRVCMKGAIYFCLYAMFVRSST